MHTPTGPDLSHQTTAFAMVQPVCTHLRIGQAAELLRVSPDTVRRLVDAGQIKTMRSAGGQRQIDGPGLARYMAAQPRADLPQAATESARNHFVGLAPPGTKDG